MLRRTDAIGVAGLVMLLVGVALFLTGSEDRLSWVYWVVGPTLWFLGFALVVGWVVWRSCAPARTSTSAASDKGKVGKL